MNDQIAESVVRYWCPNCAERSLMTLHEGEVCPVCEEEAREPFREGWDESD